MCFLFVVFVGPFLDAIVLTLIHESTHFLVFRKPSYNRLFAIFVNSVMIMPIAEIFRQHHWQHHKTLGDPEFDVDVPMPEEVRFVGTSSIRKALWLAFNMIILPVRSFKKLPVYVDNYLILNWIVCIGFGIICFFTNFKMFVYFILSTLASQGLHPANARQLQRHLYDGDKLTQDPTMPPTYSYYGVGNNFTLNVGYHQEHHDFPRIPYVSFFHIIPFFLCLKRLPFTLLHPCVSTRLQNFRSSSFLSLILTFDNVFEFFFLFHDILRWTSLPELHAIAGQQWYPDSKKYQTRGLDTLWNFIFNPEISLADFAR